MTSLSLLFNENQANVSGRTVLITVAAVLSLLLFSLTEVLAQQDAPRLDAPRFEVGGQFSFLYRNKPTTQIDFDDFFSRHASQPGLGARFTYNLTNTIAFEAEGNFFPERDDDFGVPGGQIFQAQFGTKIGKRFKKVGIFGKVRPGFVTFTKVSQLTGITVFTFNTGFRDVSFNIAEFRIAKETYFSTDLGAVVEFYPSRRIVTRFDIGDTIIRYGTYQEQAAIVCPLSLPRCPVEVFTRPAETRHNIQFSAGVGFRF